MSQFVIRRHSYIVGCSERELEANALGNSTSGSNVRNLHTQARIQRKPIRYVLDLIGLFHVRAALMIGIGGLQKSIILENYTLKALYLPLIQDALCVVRVRLRRFDVRPCNAPVYHSTDASADFLWRGLLWL